MWFRVLAGFQNLGETFCLSQWSRIVLRSPYGKMVPIEKILKPNGQVLIVEPPFHVSKSEFEETVEKAQNTGFTLVGNPKVFISKTALLKKNE